MSQFADNTWFETEQCCKCGIAFAVTTDFNRRRREDQGAFYCPAGHAQHYNAGQSDAAKLKAELARKERDLISAQSRALTAEHEAQQVTKAHKKMRTRVMNGVCPCCNRTFLNLREHMKTQHADFSEKAALSVLRMAFGMTQSAVAREANVGAHYVSLYEREKPVPGHVKERLERWVANHEAAPEVTK